MSTAVMSAPESTEASNSPSMMAHVVLKTGRYQEMVSWWTALLDARVVLSLPRGTFLTYDQEHHRVGIMNVPRLRDNDVNRSGIDHVAYTYSTLGELVAVYKRLKTIGIIPRWPMGGATLMSLYYQDPDGNRVQLEWDVGDEDAATFTRNPTLNGNSFGAPFDPDEMARLYDEGADLADIVGLCRYEDGTSAETILQDMGLGKTDVDG